VTVSVTKVGVTNNLFAGHAVLRQELLARYPDSTFHDAPHRPTEDEVIALLADRDAAIVGLEPITERVLSALPNLKVIGKMGIGCDTLDFDALRKHKILFGYRAGTNRLAVAELTLCYMIAALRWVMPLNIAMRGGERPRMRLGKGLTGRVVGIHGCGNVGKEVVRLLKPFNCEIIVCDIENYADFYRENGVRPVSFDELVERSEVLSLHVPKTAATIDLYDAKVLARLRPDCVLINTCRGGIVNEDALTERLAANKLAAACFDVFAVEPATVDTLINLPNMLASPHIGAATDEARITMGMAAIEGLTENQLVRPGQTF
jgi:phosphoglycerate dehydrogenase-like enzyme